MAHAHVEPTQKDQLDRLEVMIELAKEEETCYCGRPASPRSYVTGTCSSCGFVAHVEGY